MRAGRKEHRPDKVTHVAAGTEANEESNVKVATVAKLRTDKEICTGTGLFCGREKNSGEGTRLFEEKIKSVWE